MARYVKSHTKKDGTFVSGYYRNGNSNFSWKPNDNKPNQQPNVPNPIFICFVMASVILTWFVYENAGFWMMLIEIFGCLLLFGQVDAYYAKKKRSN